MGASLGLSELLSSALESSDASSGGRCLESVFLDGDTAFGRDVRATCFFSANFVAVLAILLELFLAVFSFICSLPLDGADFSSDESLSLSTNSWLNGILEDASRPLEVATWPGSGTGVRFIPFIVCLQSHSPRSQNGDTGGAWELFCGTTSVLLAPDPVPRSALRR